MRILTVLAAATVAVDAFITPAHAAGPLGEPGGTLALPLRDAVQTADDAAPPRT
ncbi:hypothetical protein ABT033_35980 [Streptomyces pharetrae]|uniref:hypothetical protein n=1 Tax=Streptomyces pharetrae TaxID=291370 RepID=UPI00335E638A